ncbi:hypothetical protein [Brachybacterium sacelli]|uniref:Uncharacterized protein n=1 Tax=Brachybacterium sacelli TaxID=173364 RepID=A0ABS4X2Y6_9MICO|nr:hypothetical protein [Brachybacterium sacelli]MBP2382834.1 hypothetical protein [Brachybacterium sacelli]
MGSKMIQGFVIGTIVLLVLTAAFWLIPRPDPETGEPSQDGSTDVAVLPSDGGSDQPVESDAPSPPTVEDTSESVGDRTEPEQVARAFVITYPGDIQSLADPTFLASLDRVDAPLLEQVTDLSVEQVDHASGDIYERYAFTVSGTYEGVEMQVYSIVVARPTEPAEGGGAADNTFEYKVHSFDWSPDMLGDDEDPGPAANLVSPLTAQQRGDLMSETRTNVIAQVLTVDPEESDEQRQARLDKIIVEPTSATPPMSRSGRYAMRTEIHSQVYATEPGGAIIISYNGSWVDPYDAEYHGTWALTATIVRDDNAELVVQSVEETPTSDGNDE